MTVDLGDLVTLTVTFTDAEGQPADPETVSLKIKQPSGTVITATPTRESLGVFKFSIVVNASGDWFYRFEGAGGDAPAVNEGIFSVARSYVL